MTGRHTGVACAQRPMDFWLNVRHWLKKKCFERKAVFGAKSASFSAASSSLPLIKCHDWKGLCNCNITRLVLLFYNSSSSSPSSSSSWYRSASFQIQSAWFDWKLYDLFRNAWFCVWNSMQFPVKMSLSTSIWLCSNAHARHSRDAHRFALIGRIMISFIRQTNIQMQIHSGVIASKRDKLTD